MNLPVADSENTIFSCERLNPSTFLILEQDNYDEHPFIYAKIYEDPPLLVLCDTGCGGMTHGSDTTDDSLRNFIETSPVPENGGKPLNPRTENGNSVLKYLIICTHCHYDHILGIPSFLSASPVIMASAGGKSFIEENLPKHSLCDSMNIPAPNYKVSYWAKDEERISFESRDLGIQVLHTPGHTPDELAWFDKAERHLYVGDSFYERVAKNKSYSQAIVFPEDGNIVHYLHSLQKMLAFVSDRNKENGKSAIRLGCGHTTASVDAEEILLAVQQYFESLLAGTIPVKESFEKREEKWGLWQEPGEPRFSVMAPYRLMNNREFMGT